MLTRRCVFVIQGLMASLALLAVTPSARSQQTGKCSYCVWVVCESQLSGKCQAGSVSSKCSTSGSGCPLQCTESMFCNMSASISGVASKNCNSTSTKERRSHAEENGTIDRL